MLKLNLKQTLTTAAAAGALSLSVGMGTASAVTVGGVTFNTGVHFEVASIFENVITGNGQTLSGYGEVSQINGKNAFEFDTSGFCQTGCELTYVFGGYTSKNFTASSVEFDGGWVNFYVGFGADNDFDASKISATNLMEASNGSLWLSLAGHTNLVGGVLADIHGTGSSLGSGNDVGNGSGLLDVDDTGLLNGNLAAAKGLANDVLNTDTVPDNLGGFADFDLFSNFGQFALPPTLQGECFPGGGGVPPALTDPTLTCLSGSASLRGVAAFSLVSEPAMTGVFGLGLLGMGVILRRRRTVVA